MPDGLMRALFNYGFPFLLLAEILVIIIYFINVRLECARLEKFESIDAMLKHVSKKKLIDYFAKETTKESLIVAVSERITKVVAILDISYKAVAFVAVPLLLIDELGFVIQFYAIDSGDMDYTSVGLPVEAMISLLTMPFVIVYIIFAHVRKIYLCKLERKLKSVMVQ